MRKLRSRETKYLAQDSTVCKWNSQNENEACDSKINVLNPHGKEKTKLQDPWPMSSGPEEEVKKNSLWRDYHPHH